MNKTTEMKNRLAKTNLYTLIFCIACATPGLAQPDPQRPNPDILYEQFAKAYDDLSAASIAALYTEDAVIVSLYEGVAAESNRGQEILLTSFEQFFAGFKQNGQRLRLTFKIADRKQEGDAVLDNGFYQLEFLTGNRLDFVVFGKFSTVLTFMEGQWKLQYDANANADFTEYENAGNKLVPERDEELYPDFYDGLLGNYITPGGELLSLGRSPYRLYLYNESTNEFHGLNKVSAKTWTAGSHTISDEVDRTFQFEEDRIEIYRNEKLISHARKVTFYATEQVSFYNEEEIALGGTLFVPAYPNGKGVVLVHGSGPQDRNGYASIIRLFADVLARNGTTVLTYDKQGVGSSSGDWQTEGFAELAQDAIAGIRFLKSRESLELTKIGLGGSSQAGWIIAKAVEAYDEVDFAFTLGAAGSGVSVVEQNLYNTEVRLRCSGDFTDDQIDQLLQQQTYFFDFLEDKNKAAQLDNFTKKIRSDRKLQDWLFPTSQEVDLSNRNQWFTALEVHYDPLPAWKAYDKPVFMIFSEYDDSTPSDKIISDIEKLQKDNIKTLLLAGTQHIGLEASSKCKSNLGALNQFNDLLFPTLVKWIDGIE